MIATGKFACGIVRIGSIVIERLAVDDCDALSVALTVKLDVSAAVGVPLIVPVLPFIDKPAGSEPAETVHVKDVPIVGGTAESAAEYGDWTSP
jgi:hypothetical protein